MSGWKEGGQISQQFDLSHKAPAHRLVPFVTGLENLNAVGGHRGIYCTAPSTRQSPSLTPLCHLKSAKARQEKVKETSEDTEEIRGKGQNETEREIES